MNAYHLIGLGMGAGAVWCGVAAWRGFARLRADRKRRLALLQRATDSVALGRGTMPPVAAQPRTPEPPWRPGKPGKVDAPVVRRRDHAPAGSWEESVRRQRAAERAGEEAARRREREEEAARRRRRRDSDSSSSDAGWAPDLSVPSRPGRSADPDPAPAPAPAAARSGRMDDGGGFETGGTIKNLGFVTGGGFGGSFGDGGSSSGGSSGGGDSGGGGGGGE